MASVTHECCKCGHTFFDNHASGDCPKCGHHEITSHFDEPFEVEDIRSEIYEGHRAAGLVPMGGMNGRVQ